MRKPLLAAAVLLLASSSLFAAEEMKKDVHHAVARGSIVRVFVELPVSELTIASAASSEIDVNATIKREHMTERGERKAKEILDASNIEIAIRGKSAYIRPKFGPAARGWGRSGKSNTYKATITLPRGIDVNVDQSVGELKMAGEFGDVEINIGVGDLDLKLPKRDVKELIASATVGEIRSDLGERVVTQEGLFAGSTQFINDNGRTMVKVRIRVGDAEIELTD